MSNVEKRLLPAPLAEPRAPRPDLPQRSPSPFATMTFLRRRLTWLTPAHLAVGGAATADSGQTETLFRWSPVNHQCTGGFGHRRPDAAQRKASRRQKQLSQTTDRKGIGRGTQSSKNKSSRRLSTALHGTEGGVRRGSIGRARRLLAPLAVLALKTVTSIAMAAVVGLALFMGFSALPPILRWWRIRVFKMMKATARRNPVETLQLELIDRKTGVRSGRRHGRRGKRDA